jgi:hypothetical protein
LKPIRLADVQRLKASAGARLQKRVQEQEQKQKQKQKQEQEQEQELEQEQEQEQEPEQVQDQSAVGQTSLGPRNKRKFSDADGFDAKAPEKRPELRCIKVA